MDAKRTSFLHKDNIGMELKNDLKKIITNDGKLDDVDIQKKFDALVEWLYDTPKFTTIRVNILMSRSDLIINHLQNSEAIGPLPKISTYPGLPELIVVARHDNLEMNEMLNALSISRDFNREVIVDEVCGAAVLRGSHIFTPGVMGLTAGSKVGDGVKVFADIYGQCRKGLAEKYDENLKVFLGYGILQQNRSDIFSIHSKGSGIAVLMTKTVSGLPQLSNESLPKNSGLLQNLPSIICSRILNPQPGEIILDMCAAPGNKTTHLSALMTNQGIIIAIDKVKSKIRKLEDNCNKLGCTNVRIFCFDATKSLNLNIQEKAVINGPPFNRQSFDRILLDGPCSVLGKRPQFCNKISLNELRSFVGLQRKLFSAAVELLKPGGVLVYSTCTITIAENEGIIAWSLKKYSCLRLISAREKYYSLGLNNFPVSGGYCIENLSDIDANFLLRFGPESDFVGFFIALFIKKNE